MNETHTGQPYPPPEPNGIRVRVHRCLRDAREGWESVERRGGGLSVFDGYEYADRWMRHFARGRPVRVLSVVEDGETRLILPLYERGWRRCRHAAIGEGLADNAPIPLADAGPRVFDALVGHLSDSQGRWSCLSLNEVPEAIAAPLIERARTAGLPVHASDGSTCPYLPTGGGWDTLMEGVSGQFRNELGRKRRKLDKQGAVSVEFFSPVPDYERTLDEMAHFEFATSGKAGLNRHLLAKERQKNFLRETFRALNEAGRLHLATMRLDGKLIAYQIGFVTGGRYTLYNKAYDPDFAKWSPSMLLEAETIRAIADAGITEYNFSRGKDRAKARWQPEERRQVNLRIYAKRPAARLSHAAYAGWVRFKRFAGRRFPRLKGRLAGVRDQVQAGLAAIRGGSFP